MRKAARALALSLMFASFCLAQETKPVPKTAYTPVPVKAAREPNPVKATPESIAEGKKIYGYDCAQCHGPSGDGKTVAGKQMKVPDLTDPDLLKDRSDGELFYVIKNGGANMPREADRAQPEQLWDLVNYVRSLARTQTPAEAKPEK